MKFAIYLFLLSTSAWAAPDRQFICKYAGSEERSAFFVSVTPDGSKLTGLRYEGNPTEIYDLSRVDQFRYSRDAAGKENFFAFHNGGESAMSFFLEFSGSTTLLGKFSNVLVDSKREREPAVIFEMDLSCARLL